MMATTTSITTTELQPLTKDCATQTKRKLTLVERAMMGEITKARGYMEGFEKLRDAHSTLLSLLAIVNIVAFLQPPKSWRESDDQTPPPLNSVSVMYRTGSIEAFAISNSLSLYSAISGLLFYLYCSNVGILSIPGVEVPTEEYDVRGIQILHRIRACLRRVALPSLRWHATILSSFLAASLTFSVMAFIASGYAATSPDERLHYVLFPGIPGCIVVLGVLLLALRKHRVEMNFDKQFENYWEHVALIKKDQIPCVQSLSSDIRKDFQGIPLPFLARFFVNGNKTNEPL